jgi:hypothetical protein
VTDPGTGGTEKPRPQYGEYATPEQQAAAAGIPYRPHAHAAPPHGQVPAAVPPPPAHDTRVGGPGPAPTGVQASGRRWDFVLSSLLLGYGLFTVLVGSAQYTDLAGLINTQLYAPQKIGTFVSSPLSERLGVVIVVSQIVLYVLTAAITVARLRAGRIAFWVPICGALVFGAVVFACLASLVLGDPAYQAWVAHLGTAG